MIPKAIRDEAGLGAGTDVEVAFRDGRIEIQPAGFRCASRGAPAQWSWTPTPTCRN